MAKAHRHLHVERADDVTIVCLGANMADIVYSKEVMQELLSLLEPRPPKRLLLNLADVEYLQSAVFGHLILLNQKAKAVGCELRLCELRPVVAQSFGTLKLDRILDVLQDEQSALEDWN
jgi:anti-anti-sigma factor